MAPGCCSLHGGDNQNIVQTLHRSALFNSVMPGYNLGTAEHPSVTQLIFNQSNVWPPRRSHQNKWAMDKQSTSVFTAAQENERVLAQEHGNTEYQ